MADEMLSLPPADEGERLSEGPMGHATSLRRHHRRRARQRPGDTPGLGLRALSRQTAAPVCAAAGGHLDLRRPVLCSKGALIGEPSVSGQNHDVRDRTLHNANGYLPPAARHVIGSDWVTQT